jgi:hypothetical protein
VNAVIEEHSRFLRMNSYYFYWQYENVSDPYGKVSLDWLDSLFNELTRVKRSYYEIKTNTQSYLAFIDFIICLLFE